jgi:hypothetical protein
MSLTLTLREGGMLVSGYSAAQLGRLNRIMAAGRAARAGPLPPNSALGSNPAELVR